MPVISKEIANEKDFHEYFRQVATEMRDKKVIVTLSVEDFSEPMAAPPATDSFEDDAFRHVEQMQNTKEGNQSNE